MSILNKWHFDYSWAAARADLLAGATVAAIAIPQGMAYALIAGVDPRFGLYSAIVVTIIASVLGSSSHLINGPTNAISLVVFSALASFDGRSDPYQAMFLLGIIVGIIQILIAVFKLGDLTRYVSESVILGFMAGAGLLVAIGQMGNFLGAGRKKGSGDHSVIVRFWETLTQGGPFSPYAIGLGAGTIIAVLLLRRVINKYKLPQMDMLLALIAASAVAVYFGWSIPAADGKTLVSVVGKVPAARADSLLIYDLEGELFFGAAPELDRALEEIKQETLATGVEYLVLRLRRTRNPDVVAMEHIEHFLREAEKRGVTVLLAGVRPDLQKILHNLKFHEWLPKDRVFPEEDQKYSATLHAVRHAYELLARRDSEAATRRDKREALYYLV